MPQAAKQEDGPGPAAVMDEVARGPARTETAVVKNLPQVQGPGPIMVPCPSHCSLPGRTVGPPSMEKLGLFARCRAALCPRFPSVARSTSM
jgi:hypothetical protein